MAKSLAYPNDTIAIVNRSDLFWNNINMLLMKDMVGDNLIYYRGCHWFWKLSEDGTYLDLWLLTDGVKVTDRLPIPPEYQ